MTIGTADMNGVTPMVRQYLAVKEKYKDAILFYRMGDFYEMFFEDAKIASQILEITLTSRDKNKEGSIPLCGVPYHAAAGYIQKLVDQGHKVAICEQMEEASKARGIVRREVIRVITPGMVFEDELLSPKANNFLMALAHMGHNSTVGNHVILINGALLGGYVDVADRVFISGNCALHQFVRVGREALLRGLTKAARDVPPAGS